MNAEYQHLRARIQKLPQADVEASVSAPSSFRWLAALMASIGLAASIGVAVARKYTVQGQQGSEATTAFQIPLVAQAPQRAGAIVAMADDTAEETATEDVEEQKEAAPEKAEKPAAAATAASDAAADKAAMEAAMSFGGASAPFGFWDPAGLSKLGTPATQAWFKAAELKHSRVAMAACVGWIVNEAGIHFDGDIATGQSFVGLGKGVQAWSNVPDPGKLQILLAAGIIELASEAKQPHYMKGGRPGQTAGPFGLRLWDPLNYNGGMDEATLAKKRQMEVNNGRLAMIGAASFLAASYIPDSVPALPTTW
jgi:hypothetical protein